MRFILLCISLLLASLIGFAEVTEQPTKPQQKISEDLELKNARAACEKSSAKCGVLAQLEVQLFNFQAAIDAYKKFAPNEKFIFTVENVWKTSQACSQSKKGCKHYVGPGSEICIEQNQKRFPEYSKDFLLLKSEEIEVLPGSIGVLCTFYKKNYFALPFNFSSKFILQKDSLLSLVYANYYEKAGPDFIGMMGDAGEVWNSGEGAIYPRLYELTFQKNHFSAKATYPELDGDYYVCKKIEYLVKFPCPDIDFIKIASSLLPQEKFSKLKSLMKFDWGYIAGFRKDPKETFLLIVEIDQNGKPTKSLIGKIEKLPLNLSYFRNGKGLSLYSGTDGSGESPYEKASILSLKNGVWETKTFVDASSSFNYNKENSILAFKMAPDEGGYGPGYVRFFPPIKFSKSCTEQMCKKINVATSFYDIEIDLKDIENPTVTKCLKTGDVQNFQ